MDLAELKTQLKNNTVSGIYLFSGREDYLKQYYIQQLIESVLPGGDDGLNYLRVEYSQVRVLDMTDYMQALPVFAERKILHLTALDTDTPRKDIAEAIGVMLTDFPEYLVVVFERQTTDPQNQSVAFADIKKLSSSHVHELILNEQDADLLKRWMIRRSAACGKTLPDAQAEYLLSITDNNMLLLGNELNKICAYAKESTIHQQDIDAVTVRTIDAQIYELADAILAVDAAKCMIILDDLLEKFPDTMVLASVYNCFSRLYRVGLGKERGLSAVEIAKQFNIKQGTVNKNLRILRSFSLDKIKRLIAICADADSELKRISRDKRKSMDVFLLRLMDCCKK